MVERDASANLEVRLGVLVAEGPREPLGDGKNGPLCLPDRPALAGQMRDLHRCGTGDLLAIADIERHSKEPRLHAGAEDDVHDREAQGDGMERVDPEAVLRRDLLGGPLLEPEPSEAEEQAIEQKG